jgi:hypothetical protein
VACEQRKLAAILATDVVGYSRLMGRESQDVDAIRSFPARSTALRPQQ